MSNEIIPAESKDNKKLVSNDGYIVVLEYTDEAMGYKGVRTWSSYSNKKEFEKRRNGLKLEKIIAEGVSTEEAKKLVEETPIESYVCAAIDEAVEADGSFDQFVYKMKMETIMATHPDLKLLLINFDNVKFEKYIKEASEKRKKQDEKWAKFSSKVVYEHEEIILEPYRNGKQDLESTISRLREEMLLVTTQETIEFLMKEHGIEITDVQLESIYGEGRCAKNALSLKK